MRSPDPFPAHGFGASAPWLDLANSAMWDGFGHYTDWLADPRWIRSFLRYWHLRIPGGTPEAIKALHELRDFLRHLVEKDSVHSSLGAVDLAKINVWLKVPVFPQIVENQSGFALELQAAQFGWQSEVAAIARSFVESLLHESKGHLKICANTDCRWIFIDRTKGNVRRWCNDATCGNRDRVRRSRAARQSPR
jgi:predicted RNA-binding Zn ribbon-like protein